MSPTEVMLCEAYEAAGRFDLSECVKGGRFYHTLRDALSLSFDREDATLHVLLQISHFGKSGYTDDTQTRLQAWGHGRWTG